MTDKLISDLGAIGAAIADNTAFEAQRNGQTTTEQALGSDVATYIGSKNLSNLANAATARANLGLATTGAMQLPFYPDANSGVGPLACGASNSLVLTNQRLYLTPFVVPETKTFVGFNINVTAREAAKGIRIGLYNANQATRQPTTLIVDAGIVDLDTSTGVLNRNTKTISQALSPGIYYAAFLSNAASTGAVTGVNTPQASPLGYSLTSGGSLTPIVGLLLTGQTYQAFATALSDLSALTFSVTSQSVPVFVLN